MARRLDGRVANQLRPLTADFGLLSAADGSARFAFGDTRVLAGVFGPRPLRSLRSEDPDRAVLEFTVHPSSGMPTPREHALEVALHKVFASAIVVAAHPRTLISVSVLVQHDDGALLAAAINCVTLALADAGVPLWRLLAAVSLGLDDGSGGAHAPPRLDLLAAEEGRLPIVATLAFSGGGADPVLWHQHGAVALSPPACAALARDARLAADAVLAFVRLALSRRVDAGRACLPTTDEAAVTTDLGAPAVVSAADG